MPSLKRPGDSGASDSISPSGLADSDAHLAKIQRSESADFSGAVKKKLSGASRTGQACDRCKVRKIRCDARPGGCSPCAQNNTQCKTTDRITGRATSRGHVETLETDNAELKQYIAELRRQIREQGIEPRPGPGHEANGSAVSNGAADDNHSAPSDGGTSPSASSLPRPDDPHSLANILNPAPYPQSNRNSSSVLPEYKSDSVGDNYLGVSSANEWPCPASGTSHSLFGMDLDLKDFVISEDEEFARSTTYESFFKYAFEDRKTDAPPLPPYQQTRQMCEIWFKLGGCWVPFLHKPDFLAMVDKVYHDPTFKMSDAETVQLHCLIGMLLHQVSVRTRAVSQFKWSDHYRYAVGFWGVLMRGSDVPSIQALCLIMCNLRNFQRPGAFWIVSCKVLTKVVEAGFHRSVRAWKAGSLSLSKHEIEMRKRIFWSVLQCHAALAIRLGRPMLVRLDDFDVEMPEIINDNLPEETDLPEHRKCSFIAAHCYFKLLVIQLQMHSQLFTIRPKRQDYEQLQKKLNKQLDFWVSSIPKHIASSEQKVLEDKAFRLYLDFSHQGTRLLIHHPAFLRKRNDALMKRNLDTCLDASSRLLDVAKELKALKMLDVAWHNTTYYLNAIFTTLFAYSYRKDELTAADLKDLKRDMEAWLEIMSDVGQLLGSGKRLPLALRQIMTTVIVEITKYLSGKTNGAAPTAPVKSVVPKASPPTSTAPTVKPETHTTTNAHVPVYQAPVQHHEANNFTHPPSQPTSAHPSYPPADNFSYPDPSTHIPAYAEDMYAASYPTTLKTDISSMAHSALTTPTHGHPHEQQLQPNDPRFAAMQQQNFFYTNGAPPGAYAPQDSAWRAFADTMTSTIHHPEQHHMPQATQFWPASALMSLQGGGGGGNSGDGKTPSSTSTMSPVAPAGNNGAQIFTYDGMPEGLLSWPVIGGHYAGGGGAMG